jgi:hypothetical protein
VWIRRRKAGAVARDDLARRLRALVHVVDQAVLAQQAAERVIAECCRPGTTSADLARRGGRVISEYAYLHENAVELFGDAGPGSLPERVIELLMYHVETVDECLKLAFPRFWCAPSEGHRHSGLGEPARTLREAGIVLQMWIDELETTS